MSTYQEKVQLKNFTFPDFFEKCPICHGKNCATRIGFYYRWVLDIDTERKTIVLLHLPVARFLCRMKQKPKHKHHTFSLLPDTLIPYHRVSIELLMYILQLLIKERCSLADTLKAIDTLSPDACIISDKTLVHLLQLFKRTRIKLILFFQQFQGRAPPDMSFFTIEDTLHFLIKYSSHQTESPHCAAYCLSVDYYKQNGSYLKNARFLFGTASQFCI